MEGASAVYRASRTRSWVNRSVAAGVRQHPGPERQTDVLVDLVDLHGEGVGEHVGGDLIALDGGGVHHGAPRSGRWVKRCSIASRTTDGMPAASLAVSRRWAISRTKNG